MKRWKCSVCGYVHQGDAPPQKCPVCGADMKKFVLLEADGDPALPARSTIFDDKPEALWKCTVCGYVHKGVSPPDHCPVCGAPKSKFVLVEAVDAADQDRPLLSEAAPSEALKAEPLVQPAVARGRAAYYSDFLTRLHAHPISVHIPNGVLPLTVLFTFLAVFFDSTTLSLAAKCNALFVGVFMPVVVLTGLNDWRNRFESAITTVFIIKITCAVFVTLLSIVCGVWWLAQPDICTSPSAKTGLFLLLNVLNLGFAGVAGWYGGKLIFSQR